VEPLVARLTGPVEGPTAKLKGLQMKLVEIFKRLVRNSDKSVELLEKTVAGVENETRLLNQKLGELIAGLDNQSRLSNGKFTELIEGIGNQSSLLNDKLTAIIDRQNAILDSQKAGIPKIEGAVADPGSAETAPPAAGLPRRPPLAEALATRPLMIDSKTYNTEHPAYDARLVRNFPGRIFNADKP